MTALVINNLKKTYKTGFIALKGVDLEVKEGDFFALLGPNGAGKSTLINTISSLVLPTEGEIKIFGHDLITDVAEAKSCIGLVPQEINLFIFETCEQILIQAAGYYGVPYREAKKRAEKYLKILQLWDKRKTQARMLSGGMKRRLMIARALMHEPKLLILDEPTAGVDIEIRRSMWEFLQKVNEEGTTIILTTHYLEEAEMLCRHIAMIDQGNIVRHGSMQDFISELTVHTYIAELEHDLDVAPILGCEFRLMSSRVLEFDLPKTMTLNKVFDVLDQAGINVVNLRGKTNRLEQLFLRLATKSETYDA